MQSNNTSQIRIGRLSKEDRDLIKNTFKGKPDLLIALRDLLLGIEYRAILDATLSIKGVKDVIARMILPRLEPNVEVGQTFDYWMGIKHGKDEDYKLNIRAMDLTIKLFNQAISSMDDPKNMVDLRVDTNRQDLEEFLIARANLTVNTELQINSIRTIAEQEPETEAEEIKRKFKNSNK